MKLLIKLFVCLVLLLPAAALAELPEQVERDFAVLDGVVVMQVGDEYLVDLDSSDALREGDILTLVVPGQQIVHPQTGKVIGTIDTPQGFLQVTRIKSGYSYARLLSAEIPPAAGAPVRRFEQVPARIDDRQAGGSALAQQLTLNLSQLDWLPQGSTTEPLLTFILENDEVRVNTPGDVLLHSYPVTESQQLYAPSEPVTRSFLGSTPPQDDNLLQQVTKVIVSPFSSAGGGGPGGIDPAIVRQGTAQRKGVWMSPNIAGSPVGIAVGDLDGDGLQETAVALESGLLIAQVSQGEYLEKATVPVPPRLQILSMDALDLDQNGQPELYLTAVDTNFQLASFVVKHTGSVYQVVMQDIRWYLRAADLPGRDRVLIGQEMGRDKNAFFGNPFLVSWQGEKLAKGEAVPLPKRVNLYSFTTFTGKENQLLYAYLTDGDHLKVISASGAEMWESSDYYGGSEACFDNRSENRGDMVVPTCIGPRLIRTPTNEILVVQNEGQRIMQRYRKFKKSRLYAMRWNGFVLEEKWQSTSQQGYLGDFALADADNDGDLEVVMAVKFKHKGLTDEARTSIVIYELR
jgi:hypothetical protein